MSLFLQVLKNYQQKKYSLSFSLSSKADFEITLLKAYTARRWSSLSANVLFSLEDLQNDRIDHIRGVGVLETYFTGESDSDVITFAIEKTMDKLFHSFDGVCALS